MTESEIQERNNKGKQMDREKEKRNSRPETAQDDRPILPLQQGVGGRQADPPASPGGGGYQNICTVLNFCATAGTEKKRDPRLDELGAMGLPRTWMRVAEAVGFDAFLQMWRILDADESLHDGNMIQAAIRPYRSYLRFQRNRYIETLAALDVPSSVIREMLKRQLGEEISERHIFNLSKNK